MISDFVWGWRRYDSGCFCNITYVICYPTITTVKPTYFFSMVTIPNAIFPSFHIPYDIATLKTKLL